MTNKTWRNVFLTFLFLGVFGRWIFLPAIKNIHQKSHEKEQLNLQIEQLSCVRKRDCQAKDLRQIPNLIGENRALTREYLNTHKNLFTDQQRLFYFLKGFLVGDATGDKTFLSHLNKQNMTYRESFFQGLLLCHHLECFDYFKEYEALLNFEGSKDFKLRLKLKSPYLQWHEKNKHLQVLLSMYQDNQAHSKSIDVIDFIPNHPALKSFIEKHFHKINGEDKSRRASIYLSRYVRGWHQRRVGSLNELSFSQLKYFILSLKNDCPGNLVSVLKAIKEHPLYEKSLKSTLGHELRYLAMDYPKIRKEFRLTKEDMIKDSLCHRSEFN